MIETPETSVFNLGLTVGCAGVVLVAVALWAAFGWPAAVGFVGTLAIVLGVAILRVRG